MGQVLDLAPEAERDEPRARLAAVHKRRDQLVAMRKQEKARIADAEQAWQDAIERHIAWLDAEIAVVERQCRDLIRSEPTFERLYALLCTIPGIGPVTATTLIALMPELGNRSPKAIAALAGLAPFNVDSGTFRGQRRIRGGRKRVRDALYMAAVTAARSHSRFSRHVQNIRAQGKPFKVAIIALARKILITANAITRDGRAFQP